MKCKWIGQFAQSILHGKTLVVEMSRKVQSLNPQN